MKYKVDSTVELITGEIVTIKGIHGIKVKDTLRYVYYLGKSGELGFEELFHNQYKFQHYGQAGSIFIDEDVIKGLHMTTKFGVGDTVWYLDFYNKPKIRQDVIVDLHNFISASLRDCNKVIQIDRLFATKEDLLASFEPEPRVIGYTCVGKDSEHITIKKVKEGACFDLTTPYILDSVEEVLRYEKW